MCHVLFGLVRAPLCTVGTIQGNGSYFFPYPYLYRLSLNILKLKYILNLKYCVKCTTCADCIKLKKKSHVLVKVGSILVIKIIDLPIISQ